MSASSEVYIESTLALESIVVQLEEIAARLPVGVAVKAKLAIVGASGKLKKAIEWMPDDGI